VAERLEKVKDGLHNGLEGCTGCLGEILGEALVALVACGLLGLAWWSFRVAPYLTLSTATGVLLFSAYGVTVYLRHVRGKRLVSRLGFAAILTAGVGVLVLSYLPNCQCLG
jgi:hypothetical protein